LAHFFQARALLLDPDYESVMNNVNDERLKIFNLLLSKSKANLIYSYHSATSGVHTPIKMWYLGYQSFSAYYIARVTALLGQMSECYHWFSKSKLDSNLPPIEFIARNREFKPIINHIIMNIIKESNDYTKERIRFYNHCLNVEKNMSLIAGTSNLSESVVMRSALSKSTFNILIESDNPLYNFIAFWKPVFAPESLSAKRRLEERMKLYGLESKKEVPGDGNCQMHSISDQLTGTFDYARFIRRSIVAWLRAHGELKLANGALLKEFVHDKTWEQYCNEMSRDGIWGDHLTLIAATELFNIKVVIISSVPGDNFIIEINPELSKARRIVMMSHYAEYHYSSIQPTDPSCRNLMLE